VDRTLVESEWLFHRETLADPQNNIQDAIDFWDLTNRQDWDIVAQSQLGISLPPLHARPYSPAREIPPRGIART
jgi:Rieske 2Fe-2S family protein